MGRLSIEAFYALADAMTRPQRQGATGHICLRNTAGDAFITVMHGRAIALDSPRRIARVRGPVRMTEDLLHYFEQGVPSHRFAPAADPPTTPPDAEPLALELIVHTLLRELPPERLAAAAAHQRAWNARLLTPTEEIAFRLELPIRGLEAWLAPIREQQGTVAGLLDGESPTEETTAQLLVLLHATGHLAIADPNARAPRSEPRPRTTSGVRAPTREPVPAPRRSSTDRAKPRGPVTPPSQQSLGVREVRQKQADPERFRPAVQTKRRRIDPNERRRAVKRKQASPLPFNSARDLEADGPPSTPGIPVGSPTGSSPGGLPIKTPQGGVPVASAPGILLGQCLQDLDNNNFAGALQAAEDALAQRDDHVVKLHLVWARGMKETMSATKTVDKLGHKLDELCRLSLLTEPGLAFAHYVRGELARHAGRNDEAERCLKLALKYDPDFSVPKRVLNAVKSGEVA